MEERVHYYYGRTRMLCGEQVRSDADLPATTSFEEVTCINCSVHMVAIARSVYMGIENYEEFLELVER